MRVARTAGASPKRIAVAMEIAAMKARVRTSVSKGTASGRPTPESSINKTSVPAYAMAIPKSPPIPASSRLSVSNWRISRKRPAPSESRTAIS